MSIPLTLIDLKERLSQLEETFLLELLDIVSAQIVDRFDDLIEEKFDYLVSELEELESDEQEEQ